MTQQNAKFFIHANKLPDALAALKELAKHEHQMSGGSSNGENWYSWVDMGYVNDCTLKAALRKWRWELELDKNRNADYISFIGESFGDDNIEMREKMEQTGSGVSKTAK